MQASKCTQLDDGTSKKFGIGRKRDIFLLHGRIDNDLRKFFLRNELLLDSNADGLVENQFEFFFADASPPDAERRGIAGEVGLKECLAAKVLPVRIF